MDPNACLEAMWDSEYDTDAYNGYKASLIAWLDKGGKGPDVMDEAGRCGVMVKLTYTGTATVRWRNGMRSQVYLHTLGCMPTEY